MNTDKITIAHLRGQLENCVNHLELLKRHAYTQDQEALGKCIESANQALYRTKLSTTGFSPTLAVALSYIVHEWCENVPHDIGIKLAEVAQAFYKENLS